MILMPIIMVSPILALLLFYYFSLETALPIYIVLMIVAGYCYFVMFQSMRTKAKTGLEAMIGEEALVVEDIDPQGTVEVKGEIWTATARGEKIAMGEKVRIKVAKGMVLVVEGLDQDERQSAGGQP